MPTLAEYPHGFMKMSGLVERNVAECFLCRSMTGLPDVKR